MRRTGHNINSNMLKKVYITDKSLSPFVKLPSWAKDGQIETQKILQFFQARRCELTLLQIKRQQAQFLVEVKY